MSSDSEESYHYGKSSDDDSLSGNDSDEHSQSNQSQGGSPKPTREPAPSEGEEEDQQAIADPQAIPFLPNDLPNPDTFFRDLFADFIQVLRERGLTSPDFVRTYIFGDGVHQNPPRYL